MRRNPVSSWWNQAAAGTTRRFAAMMIFVACALATGCKGTFLELQFTGPTSPDVRIRMTLTLTPAGGGRVTNSTGFVPRAAEPPDWQSEAPIRLPASLALQLDGKSGTLRIDAEALDASLMDRASDSAKAISLTKEPIWPNPLASASQTTTIMDGQTWTVVMNLQ